MRRGFATACPSTRMGLLPVRLVYKWSTVHAQFYWRTLRLRCSECIKDVILPDSAATRKSLRTCQCELHDKKSSFQHPRSAAHSPRSFKFKLCEHQLAMMPTYGMTCCGTRWPTAHIHVCNNLNGCRRQLMDSEVRLSVIGRRARLTGN